ncbi:MAG: SseB family protein [Austwickia sp.]|nr:MAG: SseB family protein [Austwickia sp.]
MTDSGGVPWAGRQLEPATFAGDTGAADAAVLAALRALAEAPTDHASTAETHLMAELAGARVLVPLVAAPADDGSEDGSSMATALLRGPDGTRALPVFSSVAALSAWDPAARPVPMRLPEAARSALDEGCAAMPIDLADPHAAVLRGSQLWALALGERWAPAHTDPVVRLAVAEASQGIDGLVSARVEDGALHAPGTLRLVLTLRPGLPGPAVDGIVTRLGERISADPDVRRRIDDLAVVLHQANDPEDQVPPDAASD